MKPSLFFITILITSLLQFSLFSQFVIMDVHFEILFATVIFIGIKYGWYSGGKAGIWMGLVNDLFSSTPFGFSIFLFSLSGFIVSFFESFIFTQNNPTRLLILFIMSTVSSFLTIVFQKGLFAAPDVWSAYRADILTISSVNTMLSIPLYYILDRLQNDSR